MTWTTLLKYLGYWLLAAVVAAWIWHRFCRLSDPGRDQPGYPPYGAQPAQESPKPRREFRIGTAPCCGELDVVLCKDGHAHRRWHRCRIPPSLAIVEAVGKVGEYNPYDGVLETAERLTEPEPKEAA